jgi:hypothetical protein
MSAIEGYHYINLYIYIYIYVYVGGDCVNILF